METSALNAGSTSRPDVGAANPTLIRFRGKCQETTRQHKGRCVYAAFMQLVTKNNTTKQNTMKIVHKLMTGSLAFGLLVSGLRAEEPNVAPLEPPNEQTLIKDPTDALDTGSGSLIDEIPDPAVPAPVSNLDDLCIIPGPFIEQGQGGVNEHPVTPIVEAEPNPSLTLPDDQVILLPNGREVIVHLPFPRHLPSKDGAPGETEALTAQKSMVAESSVAESSAAKASAENQKTTTDTAKDNASPLMASGHNSTDGVIVSTRHRTSAHIKDGRVFLTH